LWWADYSGLPDTHPAALSTEGGNKMEKLMDQDKDREINYKYHHGQNRLYLGKISLIYGQLKTE